LSLLILWGAFKLRILRAGIAVVGVLVLAAWMAFYFKYEQFFVKNYGGVMTITLPENLIHVSVTWKDDHLWVENYDPRENICYFNEYSKGHLLQGSVVIKNCNPILPDAKSK
jgi:hypothetical protein